MNEKNPTLCIVAGPNGSGKTSTTVQLLHNEWAENSLYINPDNIAQEQYGLSLIHISPTSGSGKTTVSRGLMALFVKKGLKVQPFKCGPDYIDTKYHEAVCGRPSINLDTFMASPEHVRSLYARYSADADVAVVEGMMGMYDGYDLSLIHI